MSDIFCLDIFCPATPALICRGQENEVADTSSPMAALGLAERTIQIDDEAWRVQTKDRGTYRGTYMHTGGSIFNIKIVIISIRN